MQNLFDGRFNRRPNGNNVFDVSHERHFYKVHISLECNLQQRYRGEKDSSKFYSCLNMRRERAVIIKLTADW